MTSTQLSLKASDGAEIDVLLHREEDTTDKGATVVVHGFGEHSGSYRDLTQSLTNAGYVSITFDQRGHGARYSGGKEQGRRDRRGITPSYRCFLDDIGAVTDFAKQQVPGKPLALYGHSMGGNIVVNYLLKQNQSDFACSVLESPWLGLYKKKDPLTVAMAKLIGKITPNFAIFNKLPTSDLTGDADKADWIKSDELYHNRISMRMFAGVESGCAYALHSAAELALPTFLAYAKKDRIVSNDAISKFAGKAADYVTLKEYDSCHAIHNDLEREPFFRDVINFLDEHCQDG